MIKTAKANGREYEKLIREILINDDLIEAVISLPPGLFYGTGIPACVLVCNKSKPDALRDKVLFINADREYAEGKNQNKLRPEDIEKIDYVFTHKREIQKYSRLVDKTEIASEHDYNLNIRRYVDNTPEPEPEDVQAHLIGGVPETEVQAKAAEFEQFGVDPLSLFEADRPGYLRFSADIERKAAIKQAKVESKQEDKLLKQLKRKARRDEAAKEEYEELLAKRKQARSKYGAKRPKS